uniref:(S)-1-Phenylethanol dehydrogenase n=1 Tax=Pseudomonas aeruginosa TaxID=287 RepID=A0A5E5R7F1_PSEAI|nr:(S)-1-Phenylethanol dehydrogenase [Pseudomonas aeruginosa]
MKHARYVVRRFLPFFPGRAGDRRRTRHRPGIALALARAGADVAVADLDPQVAEETAAAIRSLGRRSLALGVDVSDGDSVRAMVERVATEFGRLDVAVNNAG